MDESARLMAGACQLNMDVLGEIYDLYSPGIYRYAWRLLGDVDVAEECVADTFSRFLGVLKSGKGPQNYLQAYLYRIAHNWISDYWHNCKSEVELSEIEALATKEEDPAERLADQQNMIIVRKALNQLTPDQQTVVALKYLENWDNEEIANLLNKPVGSVKSLQHRALNSLRRLLANNTSLNMTEDARPNTQQLSSAAKRSL